MVVAKASSPSAPSVNKNGFPCFNNGSTMPLSPNSIINLDKGDPLIYESYWKKMSDECTVVIKGWDLMSYLSDPSNVCWFMLPELRDGIERLHNVVGNAVTKDKHIVVGNGTTQLFQAALYALSSPQDPHPINVVAAAPYYSEYQDEVCVVRSGLYQWDGDAAMYDKNEPYIEVVTSPNNPDGTLRGPVVKSEAKGKLVYDFAYYWPQYTPITHQADHDIMLFTFSKCTGHAGSRIGWAIVKDIEVAKKMTTFVQMSSIGVSKESQTRVAKIIGVICNSYQNFGSMESELFFKYVRRLLRERWEKLRVVIEQNNVFTVAKFPRAYCTFTNESSETYPGFAWLKCQEGIGDCESYLGKLKIIGRGGKRFGGGPEYARLSMLSSDAEFNEFLMRLSNAKRERDLMY
ncbi:L-tryptophan--pyruvate aminotransferase 1-like [Gastrolobium bilobum]|uniref:L-tryptophan--pyruvate aminotransferase 1-like n=1 Tax=Gastrolobium bilobum TaxID=150636 RepID=UPI002AB1C911|nr:L-tryptophan--pyruvate aminotransferase 1-like [Gastrolobium bilobum]